MYYSIIPHDPLEYLHRNESKGNRSYLTPGAIDR